MPQCLHAAMLHCIMQPCSHSAIPPCRHAAMPPCRHAAILSCRHTAMLSCCHTAMQTYHHTAIQPFCHAAMLPPCRHAAIVSGTRPFPEQDPTGTISSGSISLPQWEHSQYHPVQVQRRCSSGSCCRFKAGQRNRELDFLDQHLDVALRKDSFPGVLCGRRGGYAEAESSKIQGTGYLHPGAPAYGEAGGPGLACRIDISYST